jgi:lipopolysaccharide/colanic/teichoic acid biosynthesis glycosyltransferase
MLFIKRVVDVVVAFGLLLLLSPILIVVALLMIKMKLGSPVIFIQERPGLNGKIFKMYKFRTAYSAECINIFQLL